MNIFKQPENVKGQALIELTIILPILVLFMSTVTPLIVTGIKSSWLDERLALRHFGQDDENSHQLLEQSHEVDRLPPYFRKDELEETSQHSSLGFSIPLLGNSFPGKIHRKHTAVTLRENSWLNRTPLGESSERDLRLSRSLSMVPAPQTSESRVPNEVRKLTLLGLAPGKTGTLEKAGFDLFHLNLDALPATDTQGGKI